MRRRVFLSRVLVKKVLLNILSFECICWSLVLLSSSQYTGHEETYLLSSGTTHMTCLCFAGLSIFHNILQGLVV